jgi:hypothetical protein
MDQDIDGIEIGTARLKELFAFSCDEDQRRWLRSLRYLSIHPGYDVRKLSDQEELLRIYQRIESLYDDLQADQLILHPNHLPKPGFLGKFRFIVSTENIYRPKYSRREIRRVLDSYPGMGLCLDLSHAYLFSEHETADLVAEFRDRITQLHLSGSLMGKDHVSLRQAKQGFLRSISPALSLNVPVIIESDLRKKSKRYLTEEIAMVKELLKKQ